MINEQLLREALAALIDAHEAQMAELGVRMKEAGLTTLNVPSPALLQHFEAVKKARAALAQPAEGGDAVDWEHIARLLDAALQELIVFVDERWGDNECRPLENAKHALRLIKED